MEQRLSLITLGVEDVARATAFYTSLGWRPSPPSNETITFFQMGGIILALYGFEDLAGDARTAVAPEGVGAAALAYNTRSRPEVDKVLAFAASKGAAILKPAEEAFWGGYSGCFADPDGHVWEVAWNPFFAIDDEGNIRLPE
jgi:catechol 2,3-dioxygenase-like lactoylglutathione lyase family enzyme